MWFKLSWLHVQGAGVRGSLHLIYLLDVKKLTLPHKTVIYEVVILDAGEGAGGVGKVNTSRSTRLYEERTLPNRPPLPQRQEQVRR